MITLQQLTYFRELAKTEHLTQTAEKLYITQTTLSNTIINLEKQLGVKLFDRVGRGLQLSDIGKKYFDFINDALISLENAQTMINDYKDDNKQSVSVAMTSSSVWANLITDFKSKYRSYYLRQIDCDKMLFHDLLTNQEIDFVIAAPTDMPLSGLEHHILREEHLFLCVSKDHHMAGLSGVYLKEASNESFITLSKTSGFRDFCDSMLEKVGIKHNIAVECDYMLRGKLVSAGFGVTITSNSGKDQNILGPDIVYIPILDDFARRPISIIWNPKHYFSRAATDFKKYVIETVV